MATKPQVLTPTDVSQEILAKYNSLETAGERAAFSHQCKLHGLPQPWKKAARKNEFAALMTEWKAKLQA